MSVVKFSSAVSAWLLLSVTPTIAADWEGVFEGTLGKAKILVELNAGQEKTEYKGGFVDGSRYSYLPKAFDLKLVLEQEGDTLEFAESTLPYYLLDDLPADDPGRTGHWSLKVSDEGASGTWTSIDGKKTLPIKLKRLDLVDEENVPEHESQLTLTYGNRWFETVKIGGATDPKTFGEVTLAFERDSAFNLDMPVFTRMPDKKMMERANALLRQYYRKSLLQNRDCINGLREEPAQPFEPQYNITVSYASPRVISLQEGGSVDCGGAHPNNYVSYLTFDLVNGKQIGGDYDTDFGLEGFGTVLKLANGPERTAFEKFALGRWAEAAKAAGDTGEDSCSSIGFMNEQKEGEKVFTLAFDPTGLVVQRTDFPSVAANCLFQDFNPTIIPWKDVKEWLKPGQVLLKEEVE